MRDMKLYPKSPILLRCVAMLAVLAAVCVAPRYAMAQGADLDRFAKVDLSHVPEEYKEWFLGPVTYLMTDAEYEIFLRLDTDSKYRLFIERFWKVRDPTPGTPRNEYLEQHQERVAHANKFLGRATSREGWETDKGRIWITLGEPVEQNRINSDQLIYPVEIWMYTGESQLELPPFFWVAFYQRFGAGEYKIYSPLSDGPERLLNAAGEMELDRRANSDQIYDTFAPTGFGDQSILYTMFKEIDIDLSGAAFTLYPSEQGFSFGITPLRSEMLLAQIQGLPEIIMPDATWALNVLTGIAESDVQFETLSMSATAIGLIDVDGEPFVHFATQTKGSNLNMTEYEENFFFSFDAAGSLTTADKKVLRNFDANMSGEMEEEQARRFNSQQFIYLDMVPSIPGSQTFQVTLQNKVAHTFGQTELQVEVPRAHPDRVTLVGPLLALDAREAPEYDPFAERFAFQYANVTLVPSVDGEWFSGQPVLVFQQTLMPAGFDAPVMSRYELRDSSGKVVREGQHAFGPDEADDFGVIPHVWSIDSAGLPLGDYTVQIKLDGSGQVGLQREMSLVSPPEKQERPFINAQPALPPTDVNVAVDRSQQYLVIGEIDTTVEILAAALERDPENMWVRAHYVEALKAAGDFETVTEILVPVVLKNPRNVVTMLEVARAYAESGNHYDSIRYYERARIVGDVDDTETLNALANEYLAEGRVEKGQEVLRLSLELDAEQPEIQEMLARLSSPIAEPTQ